MPTRRMTLWLLMFATVLALFAADGSSAQASCGDYLIEHGQHQSSPVPSNLRYPAPSSKTPDDGPRCQKSPVEPTPTVPVKIVQPEPQRLGCLCAGLTLTPATQTVAEFEHSELPHSGHRTSIEHPPRA